MSNVRSLDWYRRNGFTKDESPGDVEVFDDVVEKNRKNKARVEAERNKSNSNLVHNIRSNKDKKGK